MLTILSYIHWNFDPDIFVIFNRPIRWYGLMFAIGFIFGYSYVEKQFKHEKENLKWLESLFMFIIVGTVVGARLGHVFFYAWDYYSQHPFEILYQTECFLDYRPGCYPNSHCCHAYKAGELVQFRNIWCTNFASMGY